MFNPVGNPLAPNLFGQIGQGPNRYHSFKQPTAEEDQMDPLWKLETDGKQDFLDNRSSKKTKSGKGASMKRKEPDELSYRVLVTPTDRILMGDTFKKPDTVVLTLSHHL